MLVLPLTFDSSVRFRGVNLLIRRLKFGSQLLFSDDYFSLKNSEHKGFGWKIPQIVSTTNIMLQRDGIWNLAPTPWRGEGEWGFKFPRGFWKPNSKSHLSAAWCLLLTPRHQKFDWVFKCWVSFKILSERLSQTPRFLCRIRLKFWGTNLVVLNVQSDWRVVVIPWQHS